MRSGKHIAPDRGYCPICGHRLHPGSVTVGGRGYCERDGWQWADWTPPPPKPPPMLPAGVRVW